jgi:hypothetical protein
MIPYVGCDHARDLLDEFIDGELAVTDQVAVESHLRWCRTCCARVEDLRLIGSSIRVGSPAQPGPRRDAELAAVSRGVLMLVRAEREQSLGVRLREMFADMRLLWPALGATMAVAISVTVAFGVWQSATAQNPESLAAMIEALGDPGSERNPLTPDDGTRLAYADENRLAGGISIPRVMDDGVGLDGIPDEEAEFAVATVVSRDGRIANFELLKSDRPGPAHRSSAEHATHVEAVLDAVRQSRFAPAQTPGGRAVAVNMVWLIFVTTAEKEVMPASHDAARVLTPARAAPVTRPDGPPISHRSRHKALVSTTA